MTPANWFLPLFLTANVYFTDDGNESGVMCFWESQPREGKKKSHNFRPRDKSVCVICHDTDGH